MTIRHTATRKKYHRELNHENNHMEIRHAYIKVRHAGGARRHDCSHNQMPYVTTCKFAYIRDSMRCNRQYLVHICDGVSVIFMVCLSDFMSFRRNINDDNCDDDGGH